MMKFRYVYILMLAFCIHEGCTNEIDLDLEQNRKLVLLGAISPQEPLRVFLGTTSVSSNTFVNYPSNAEIIVYENNTKVGTLEFVNSPNVPHYELEYPFKPATEYQISVSHKVYPNVMSAAVIPEFELEIIAELESINQVVNTSDYQLYSITMDVSIDKESIDTNSNYHIILKRDVIYPRFVNNEVVRDTSQLEIPYFLNNEVPMILLFHEQGDLITGENLASIADNMSISADFFYDSEETDRGELYLEIRKVNEDYFEFHKSVADQETLNFNSGVFSPSANNIYNNIEDGIGNFGAYNSRGTKISW